MTAMILLGVLNVFYAGEYKTVDEYKKAVPGWLELCADLRATNCEVRTMKVYCDAPDPEGKPLPGTTECTRYSLYGQLPTTIDGVSAATYLKRRGVLR